MSNRNTTLNLPASLIARTKAYAATHGTSMTAIVREHLEAVTVEDGESGDNPLQAYADGLMTRDEAILAGGVRDYAGLLVALGDAGLIPDQPSDDSCE